MSKRDEKRENKPATAPGAKIRAKDILSLLRERFGKDPRRYICASEVALSTGGNQRRIDFCVMTCYASADFAIEGIEIKVDAQDLRHEIQEHRKHEVFFSCLDYYSLATTGEVYKACKDLVPPHWGVYIADETRESISAREDAEARSEEPPSPVIKLTCKKKPLPLESRSESVPKGFVASFARKCVGDALAPHLIAGSQEYEKGYEKGYEHGLQHASSAHDAELEKLRGYKRICEKLEGDDGWFDKFGIDKAIELVAAMRISKLDSLYNAVTRIHEDTGRIIAALCGRFDLGEWGRRSSPDEALDDAELEDLIDAQDEMLDDIRKRIYGRH